MNRVRNALTRKIGPMPAWAWLAAVAIGIYYYRNRAGAASGTGTGSVTPGPTTPQDPLQLQPGESVYDPNTGNLISTPGAGPGEYFQPGQYGWLPGGVIPKWLLPKGKRKPKAKPHHPKRHKKAKRPRSHTGTRSPTHRRTKPVKSKGGRHHRPVVAHAVARFGNHGGAPATSTGTATARTANLSSRGNLKNPAARDVIRQRPVASHEPNRQVLEHPPRPSSPPPRTHRTQAQHKPQARHEGHPQARRHR